MLRDAKAEKHHFQSCICVQIYTSNLITVLNMKKHCHKRGSLLSLYDKWGFSIMLMQKMTSDKTQQHKISISQLVYVYKYIPIKRLHSWIWWKNAVIVDSDFLCIINNTFHSINLLHCYYYYFTTTTTSITTTSEIYNNTIKW